MIEADDNNNEPRSVVTISRDASETPPVKVKQEQLMLLHVFCTAAAERGKVFVEGV